MSEHVFCKIIRDKLPGSIRLNMHVTISSLLGNRPAPIVRNYHSLRMRSKWLSLTQILRDPERKQA